MSSARTRGLPRAPLPLTVLALRPHPTLPTRPRRYIKWRAAILIAVHILIIAHIIQWKLMGTTIAPLVAAESMYTLEQGQLNNGFLIFAAVLLMTLVVGRFLCGWACHMGGLQLFTAWLLRKAGIRPRLFRARLLGYLPLVLGLYMFVWPSFARWVLAPLLEKPWPAAWAYLRPTHPFPGWSVKLMTHDLWENLPSVWVTVPFLLVCGAATVYFLGARGFCRYGCPYGGLMQQVEQLAPGRVVVDKDKCDACGICTAACTSGVRVLDELRAHGRVVNKLCTRSMDCVDVCPTGALSFGWARPAAFTRNVDAKARELYDLPWGEELFILAAFTAAFFTSRGLYGQVPMLMAVGISLCVAFILWQAWRVVRDRNCRLGPLQLRLAGRLRVSGGAYLAFAACVAALGAHSATIQTFNHIASLREDAVTTGREAAFSGDPSAVSKEQRAAALAALRWYERARGWRHGGIGLTDTPATLVRMSWLNLVAGRYEEAAAILERVMAAPGASDAMGADLARIRLLEGRREQATDGLADALAAHPDWAQSRDLLARLYAGAGRWELSDGVYARVLAARPNDGWARAMFAQNLLQQGRAPEALAHLEQAARDEPKAPGIRRNLALARFYTRDVDGALSDLESVITLDPASAPQAAQLGAEMLAQSGRAAEAARWQQRAALKNQ